MPELLQVEQLKQDIKRNIDPEEFLDNVLKSLEPAELTELHDRLLEALHKEAKGEKSELIQKFSTRKFTNKERALLEFATLYRFFEKRRQLLTDALTPSQVAELFECSRQTPHDRRVKGTLLGLLDNGVWKFPAWQFDAAGPNGVVDGLPEILTALKQLSNFGKLSWLTHPNSVLKGTSPIDALKEGRRQEVLEEAIGVGSI